MKPLAALFVLAALALGAIAPEAFAEPRHHWRGKHHHYHWHRGPSAAERFWGTVLGAGIGSWLGNKLSEPAEPAKPAPDAEGELEPWSKEWLVYCSRKYKSFNPKTGQYYSYSGEYRFCR